MKYTRYYSYTNLGTFFWGHPVYNGNVSDKTA